MISFIEQPKGWLASDLDKDRTWIYQLSAEQIEALEHALQHALKLKKSMLQMSPEDFPIAPAVWRTLKTALDTVQTGVGFRLLRGFPVHKYTEDELRTFYWGIGLHIGVPRSQGKHSHFMSEVRDAGGVYRGATGRGYNTSARLDFHADSTDIVGLLVVRTAKAGGSSLLASSISAHNRMLKNRPDLLEVLYQPFTFSRQGEEAPEEAPHYQAPVFGMEQGRFMCRHIRNHINSAQMAFPEIPRLTEKQIEALDELDAILASPELCFSMEFQPGDMQFINNHIVLHARTEYEDHEESEKKRLLFRLWMSHAGSQPLPPIFADGYKDQHAGAVRGGVRGINNTPEIRAFEEGMAKYHGMRFEIY
ncbi:MAG: TauD/TfdA family dioxygenase [Pusillimonas sp.]